MGSNVDILRTSYAGLNEGSVDAAVGILAPDAVWRESFDFPGGDVLEGRDAIEAFLRLFLDSWSEFEQEIVQVREAGDRVALMIDLRAVGKASGAEVSARYAHVWTIRDGLGVEVDAYRDAEAGLRSVSDPPEAATP